MSIMAINDRTNQCFEGTILYSWINENLALFLGTLLL